jgi:predicted short-subunit dehydrogenase-like oxidoreductase (DUF2520 family)
MRPTPTLVVGAGRLARALVPLLPDAGYPVVAVAAPRLARARAVARTASARATTRAQEFAHEASLVLLAVPDGEIARAAGDLARATRGWDGVALHHAGALGVEPLAPLARAGAATGVLHPLQSLADPRLAAHHLRGARARVEGDARALAVATRLARRLGLRPLRLDAADPATARAAYHAAASIASNDVLALLDVAVTLFGRAGIAADEAIAALVPLARGTLAQAERAGVASAITGPVIRGDLDTLRAHLATLAAADPDAAAVHRSLSVRLARIAEHRGGRVSPASIRALRPAGRPRRTGL